MPNLTNSITSVLKATHVPLIVPTDSQAPGRATQKASYVRELNLQPGEVDAVQQSVSIADAAVPNAVTTDANFWSLLRMFEGSPLASQLPKSSAFANLRQSDLSAFGNAIVNLRKQNVQRLQSSKTSAALSATGGAPESEIAAALNSLNSGAVAWNKFTADSSTSPIGMLNLERLEMTPAGIERGGLLATIPLAPRERTAVVQKEWSVTNQEFTSIVTDSLDNYSATGVTENTQLSQSTTAQVSHSNQYNINASASGGCGFVSGSVATSFGGQDQNSQSATNSRNQAIATTRQASSRVQQSHKMTISTTTVTGTSESTTRMLENPSSTDPMRIDYFSMMRKWYVALYRYGLRLTYDITVPEPGAAMREIFAQLTDLQNKVSQNFAFSLDYSAIIPANWEHLSETFQAQLPPPPQASPPQTFGPTAATGLPAPNADDRDWHVFSLPFTVPDGCWITGVTVQATVETGNSGSYTYHYFMVADTGYYDHGATTNYTLDFAGGHYSPPGNPEGGPLLTAPVNFLNNQMGPQNVSFFFKEASPATVSVTISTEPTPMAMQQWQSAVWNACYNAAQTNYYAQLQSWNAQIAALQAQISGVDTLTLRREENDEIMKCVLRWLLGPGFEFMPASVLNLFKAAGGDLTHGVSFTGNDVGPSSLNWNVMSQYEDRVNFINQAIDWSNVVYFLYSYFWDVPSSWDFIRQIQHPDSTREAFLRAGSARVVLTVQPGWELAWTYFVEFQSTNLPNPLPPHPYLTIAQQIADYDNTNYPGIPPANPDGGGPIDDNTPQSGTTCNVSLAASASPVNIEVADSTDFVAGATLIIDTWESGAQETQPITAVPDGTHITVQALGNAHSPADGQPFPLVQAGAKGVLIGEWFEYTPTSGTDIAISSDLTTIA